MPEEQGGEELTAEQKLEALQKEVESMREENEKLKNKDNNFERLRGSLKRVNEMSEEEKKQWTQKEQAMIDRLASLEQTVEEERTAKVQTWKEAALEKYAGEDEKTREKVLYHFDRLKDEANDKKSIEAKMREATILASADKKDPIGIPFSSAGNPVEREKKRRNYTETEEGQALLKAMGFTPKTN